MAESQYGFPTEVLSLPSNGLLYPEDSPLRSGTIDVKYMTAKEEDILTSTNLIEQGVVITRLLESVIADPKVKLEDMLIGDKNAIMVGTRILGYGANYEISLVDPDTNERVEHTVDLSKLNNKKIDEKLFENGNNFEFELPNSKRIVGFKLLTHGDESEIENTLKYFPITREAIVATLKENWSFVEISHYFLSCFISFSSVIMFLKIRIWLPKDLIRSIFFFLLRSFFKRLARNICVLGALFSTKVF